MLAEVEYDLESELYSFNVSAKQSQIAKMSVQDVKDYIIGRVMVERTTKLRVIVEDLLSALINVDLEE